MPAASPNLLDDVRDSLRRAQLTPGDGLIVGLSGGVDSQTLTHALVTLRNLGDGPSLRAVHVDHQLRPESAKDALDCQLVAERLGVPFEIIRVDVDRWDRGRGVEAAARLARYAALASVARKAGAAWIALGHSLDDQVETVLLRLARGSSLDGLTAMREISDRSVPLDPFGQACSTVRLVRPLLNWRRADIEAYASEHGLVAVVDPSNVDIRFRRNAVRHYLLPLLEQIVPGAARSISRSSRLLADDAELLATLASRVFDEACERYGPCIGISREVMSNVSVPLQRRVIVMAIHALTHQIDLSSERVEALRQAALGGLVSRTIEVGDGITALVDYDRLILGPVGTIEPTMRARYGRPLFDRDAVIPIAQSARIELKGCWILDIEVNRPTDGWELRTRRTGDRMAIEGSPGKRLQDWFVNRKVPGYLRDYVPLLIHRGVVCWIPGFFSPVFKAVDSSLVARLTKQTVEDLQGDAHASGHPST